MDDAEYHEWLRGLPRKRMAAGVVFRNGDGQILLVKPSYKQGWEVPGGVVEQDESPRQATAREVIEELGVELDPGSLLSVDYCSTVGEYPESVHFLFDGGILSGQQVASISLSEPELSEMAWLPPEGAMGFVGGSGRLSRRLGASLPYLGRGCIYLENQRPL